MSELFSQPNCQTCFHWENSEMQIDASVIGECVNGPPGVIAVAMPQGLALKSVFPKTPSGFFCHQWLSRKEINDANTVENIG